MLQVVTAIMDCQSLILGSAVSALAAVEPPKNRRKRKKADATNTHFFGFDKAPGWSFPENAADGPRVLFSFFAFNSTFLNEKFSNSVKLHESD